MILDVVYNLFTTKEELVKTEAKRVVTVVFLTKPKRDPIVYDVTNIPSKDIEGYVRSTVHNLTVCTNIAFTLVNVVGNVYFFE